MHISELSLIINSRVARSSVIDDLWYRRRKTKRIRRKLEI